MGLLFASMASRPMEFDLHPDMLLATLPIRVKLNLGPDRGNELNLNMVKLLLLLGKITLKRTPHTLKPKGMLFILSQRVIRLNQ
uniref:Uncharacterized protein n=2 Tax=Picea TaxID=3328 RepID=A0A101LZ70_PICGL|nr:hypothetical protein ABT39_MTgene5072 [Picea glauca]QHR89740.1 hypothetical protein Q903MT_gene3762 [Picea sitchensis]